MPVNRKERDMKGYKVFRQDWTCRGFQYEVGKTYQMDGEISVCNRGFHFCKKAADCFSYYPFDPKTKVAEVAAHGLVVEGEDERDSKCATNKIEIVREIPWSELLEIVNTGDRNTGDYNTGSRNTGDRNTGDYNAGDYNTGDRNAGDYNTGDRNAGDCNAGDCNTGDCNTGSRNTGDRNTGDYNTGDRNTGDRNTGDFNKTSFAAGCFNTKKQKLHFFDKETDITFEQWYTSSAYEIMNRMNSPVYWITASEMTDEEKAVNPGYETTGGYLKTGDLSDAWLKWWDELNPDERDIIRAIPNFDPEKFKLITGVDTTAGGHDEESDA
jgi:hypothetical protein